MNGKDGKIKIEKEKEEEKGPTNYKNKIMKKE